MTASTVLVGQSTLLTFTAYSDGTQTDLGTITIGIVDANGDTVVASGTGVSDNADGTYEYTLVKQSEPGLLIATWSVSGGADFTEYVEVVGSELFNEYQARTFQAKADATSALIPLNSATEYTDAMIARERQRITEDLEAWTGRSFIRRYNRAVIPGTGQRTIQLPPYGRTSGGLDMRRPGADKDTISIISADDGATVSTSNIVIHPGGVLERTDAAWTKTSASDPLNVTIEYEYGRAWPVDGVDRIAMMLLVDRLVPSAFPSRTLSVDTDYGTTRFVQPGGPMGNVSGLPEVNDWVKRHKVAGFFA